MPKSNLTRVLIMDAKLVVIVGPAGVGKGTVVSEILRIRPDFRLSVSATTRSPRPGERDGISYFFLSSDEFDRKVATGEMLEWAVVHAKNRYGTPRTPVEKDLREGHTVLLEIDLQGCRQVKSAMPQALSVFIAPPSWDELERRLRGRGTEAPEELERRLETARVELGAIDEFDYVVVNDSVAECAREVVNLLEAHS